MLSLLVLGCGLAVPAAATASEAAPAAESWYDFRFYGNKVGFLHAKDELTDVNGAPAVLLHRWSVVTVRRQQEVIRLESTTDAWITREGAPLRFKHHRREGQEVRSVDGYRDGRDFVIRRNVGGNVGEERIPLTEDLRLASSLELLFARRLGPGAKMEGRALDEAEGDVQPFVLSVTSRSRGAGGDLWVVDETLGSVKSRAEFDAKGDVVKTEVLGIGAEFVRTTRELAMALEPSLDIFSSALFRVKAPMPPGHDLDELVVKLSGKSGKRPSYFEDRRQKSERVTAAHVELKIRVEEAPGRSGTLPITDAKVAAFLRETPYEPLRDERLVATAERVVADAKTVWEAARRINAFVYRHIQNKSLARAFATASEALETGEGDCTEHAVLFSALAKISGIPTRLVTGLVFVGGRDNLFGYHEWVEIWTGSGWLAMDPTFGQDVADPTHIKFAEGQSDAEGLRQAGLVAAALIGDLELHVLGYTTTAGERKRL